MSRHRTAAVILPVLLAAWAFAATAGAAVPRLVFPVVASVSYTNDFGDPRWQGRHQGNDIMAAKRSPVVAVETGRVVKWNHSRSAGCMLYLYGRSGTTYMYIHLNNDRTLRNDNRGGCRNRVAYAPGLRNNQRVQAGQLIAYVGDSGDANGIASHLHFELHKNGRRAVSPYRHLRAAHRHLYARPTAETTTTQLRIKGRVVWTQVDTDPQRIRLRVLHVTLPNGWRVRPARDVVLAVAPDAVVERRTTSGDEPVALDTLQAGDEVVAWTHDTAQTRGAARALAGRHTVRELLLRQAR
jgi:hypothetical protein